MQEVHKLKRDHPHFAPRLEAAATHQVRTMKSGAMKLVEFPAWYKVPDVDEAAVQKLVAVADTAVAVNKGGRRATAMLKCTSVSLCGIKRT